TFVDFDHSINVAIQRLREALDDSADAPRYIQTLPRRGYRFIYPLGSPVADVVPAEAASSPLRFAKTIALVLLVVMLSAALWLAVRLRNSPPAEIAKIRSLAVLPLKNLSGDAQQEYFADG